MFLTLLLAAVPSQGSVLTVRQTPIVHGSVPLGAQRVEMLRLKLTASCGADVPVFALTFTHDGAGEASDLARVYALEDQTRITRSAVPGSRDGRVTVRLRSFSVPRCGVRTLSILADVASTAAAGGEHRLSLRTAADAQTSAAVHIEAPENAPSAAQSPVARPVGPARGTITAVFLSIPLPVTYGGNRTIARFRLTADGADDHLVTALILTNDGKAKSGDLQKLFLTGSDGRRLTDILPMLEGSTARFTFDPPLRLDRNADRVLVLRADVLASRRRTIDFVLEEESDIEAEPVRGRR